MTGIPAAVNFDTIGTSAFGSVGVNTTASGFERSASSASAVCCGTLSALVGMKLNTRIFSARAAVSAPMRMERATGLPWLLVNTAIVCASAGAGARPSGIRIAIAAAQAALWRVIVVLPIYDLVQNYSRARSSGNKPP